MKIIKKIYFIFFIFIALNMFGCSKYVITHGEGVFTSFKWGHV